MFQWNTVLPGFWIYIYMVRKECHPEFYSNYDFGFSISIILLCWNTILQTVKLVYIRLKLVDLSFLITDNNQFSFQVGFSQEPDPGNLCSYGMQIFELAPCFVLVETTLASRQMKERLLDDPIFRFVKVWMDFFLNRSYDLPYGWWEFYA